MRSLSFCLILIITSSGSVGGTSEKKIYPPLYAIDVDGLNGLQIFRKIPSIHCIIYRKIERNNLDLFFTNGEWKIIDTTENYASDADGNCFVERVNILFSQQVKSPSSEGWFDHQKNTSNVNLGVYALEECFIYQGAFIDADFFQNMIIPNGNINSCQEGVSLSTTLLFTTETKSENQIFCRYYYPDSLTRGKMTLSSDENANFLLSNQNCNNPQTINISEALVHNYTDVTTTLEILETLETELTTTLETMKTDLTITLETNQEGMPWEIIGGGIGSLLFVILLVVVVVVCYCCGCCEKKKSKDNFGDYQASIDNNLQYGEDREYYHYHYDKNQTRVVDENDMYATYGQD